MSEHIEMVHIKHRATPELTRDSIKIDALESQLSAAKAEVKRMNCSRKGYEEQLVDICKYIGRDASTKGQPSVVDVVKAEIERLKAEVERLNCDVEQARSSAEEWERASHEDSATIARMQPVVDAAVEWHKYHEEGWAVIDDRFYELLLAAVDTYRNPVPGVKMPTQRERDEDAASE